jgi:hypothetical protein
VNPTAVLIDSSRRTYLKILEGPKYIHVIPMHPSGLGVLKLTPKEYEERRLRELDYPLDRALKRFREAGERFGMTSQVAAVLGLASAKSRE